MRIFPLSFLIINGNRYGKNLFAIRDDKGKNAIAHKAAKKLKITILNILFLEFKRKKLNSLELLILLVLILECSYKRHLNLIEMNYLDDIHSQL